LRLHWYQRASRYAAPWVAAYLALTAFNISAQSLAPAQERFAACLACHGEGGKSIQPLTPSLAGQPSFYAITQLFLFREGRRSNEVMTAMARGMSDDDMRAFSELIAKLPPIASPNPSGLDTQRISRGTALAQQHRCASCHGADYAGDKQVARLAHQREDYLIQTLTQFRAGKRIGYTSAMNEALAGIPHEALADLAYYLANLPKPAP
jgi:cytochrome c553